MQDDLERVRGRASAASLLLSAASAAAALMVLMAEADVSELSGCSLLDSITCELRDFRPSLSPELHRMVQAVIGFPALAVC